MAPRPHPDGPTAVYLRTLVFVFHGDDLLLIFRERPPDAGLWNAVGGKIDRGEDPLEAAQRELREEAGVDAALTFRGVATAVVRSTGEHWVIFLFSGAVGDRAVTPSPEGALRWASPAEIATLPVLPDIALLLPYIVTGTHRGILATFTYATPDVQTVESFLIRG